MATSAILSIYDALAAVTVSDGVTAIAARDIDDQPNSLTTANTPVRVLTVIDPLAGLQRARSDGAWASSQGSGNYNVAWVLYDVLIHTPLFQTRGVRDLNAKLITYMANYYDMLAAMDAGDFPAGVITVTATMQPVVVQYPLNSGHWWYAVRGMLEIQENICP